MTNYEKYLQSDRWATLSSITKHLAGYRCQVCCGAEIQLEVHHRTYENLGKPAEIDDLIALCADCHAIFHTAGKLPAQPIAPESDKDALQRIIENQRRFSACRIAS